MTNTSHKSDEILITDDVLSRYKISRSTLYFWSTPSRMPSYFAQPFPQPKINGSPKRWRLSDLLAWEDNVGSNQRLTNQLLKVILPNSKPVTLIIQIIMQVITCHDTCHMMAKQFFHNMWRRT